MRRAPGSVKPFELALGGDEALLEHPEHPCPHGLRLLAGRGLEIEGPAHRRVLAPRGHRDPPRPPLRVDGVRARVDVPVGQLLGELLDELLPIAEPQRARRADPLALRVTARDLRVEVAEEVEGPDEAEASAALQELFASGFGEALE